MDKKKRIIVLIFIKAFILTAIIMLNYFVVNSFKSNNLKEASSIGIIGGSDGPVTILVSGYCIMTSALKYSLSIILGINILASIVFDILEYCKNKTYDKKAKLKYFLGINIRIILAFIIEIVIYFLLPSLSIIVNAILISVLLIIMYSKSIKEGKNLE